MTDLLTSTIRPGEGNGKAIAYITLGESRAQLRKRWDAGELAGANPKYIDQWLREVGR